MAERCMRCGRTGTVEYGSDGLTYCNSCIFYGRNKQCWRCGMYLPAIELQQYKGQWICPNCRSDMVQVDNRMKKPEKYPMSPRIYAEKCERCGGETSLYYIYNGRRLCKSCLGEEQSKWGLVGGGPSAASFRVTYQKKGEGLLRKMIGKLLERIGLRKRTPEQSEIVVMQRTKVEIKNKGKKANIVAFSRGRPMSEGLDEEEKKKRMPRSETIVKKKKKK